MKPREDISNSSIRASQPVGRMLEFRPRPGDERILDEFEEQASYAAQVQKQVLEKIVAKNTGTEYFRRLGCTDVESFKAQVPVILHADIAEDIERIANGDQTPILSAEPVDSFSLSSGTSGGKSKMIPSTQTSRLLSAYTGRISVVLRNRDYPVPENAAVLAFVFAARRSQTKSGLMAGTATSNYFHSAEFARRDRSTPLTCPDEVILQGADFRQVMYCHLLCGLIRREQVGVVTSFFAYMVIEALRTLENTWKELCEDIRHGKVSTSRVTEPVLRKSMEKVLHEPNTELADLVEAECSRDFEGIVERLWPRTKFVQCVITGAMAPYTGTLKHYAGRVPLLSFNYGASECFPIGITMDPADPPDQVVFTLVPSNCYYEFAPLAENCGADERAKVSSEVVDVSGVKRGEKYEVLLTTFSGLYRYRLGDVIQVEGFYKSLPTFSFVRRKNVLLSINTDKTDEEELQLVIRKAGELLKGKYEIADFTSYGDVTSKPGHYVIFIEVKAWRNESSTDVDEERFQACSDMMDSSFNDPYRRGRAAQTIGPLELCVVETNTFSKLLECAISHGASASQFKTPRCITNPKMLSILQENTKASFFCNKIS